MQNSDYQSRIWWFSGRPVSYDPFWRLAAHFYPDSSG
jgi:hypothetical protein